MKDFPLSIGEKIFILRRRSGMSRKQIADILGVSPQTVANYENGVTQPETPTLTKLSNVFDINLDLLLFEPGKEENGSRIHKPKLTQSQMKNML